MTAPTPRTLRQWLPATLVGFLLATAFGAAYAWRNPGRPAVVSLIAMVLVIWPVLTTGLQPLWFDRERTDAEIDRGKEDVERMWITEASSAAFFGTMGGLVALDSLGSLLKISWLSPIGLTHVLVLGLGLFALSYGWVRVKGR